MKFILNLTDPSVFITALIGFLHSNTLSRIYPFAFYLSIHLFYHSFVPDIFTFIIFPEYILILLFIPVYPSLYPYPTLLKIPPLLLSLTPPYNSLIVLFDNFIIHFISNIYSQKSFSFIKLITHSSPFYYLFRLLFINSIFDYIFSILLPV